MALQSGVTMPNLCGHTFTPEEVTSIRKALLSWYDANKRDLPWRRMAIHTDVNVRAYAIWISEIMLQQTQVKSVIPYYKRWMEKWPTVLSLSKASMEEVNSLWSGLGYYSRARLVHEGATKVVSDYDGIIPSNSEQLRSNIPGVGRYTAGAIASIAFNERVPVLDGNVIRVLTRLRRIGAPVQLTSTNTLLWELADQLVDPDRPGDFNQSVMELGAILCTPKQPSCSVCPLGAIGACVAYTGATVEVKTTQAKASGSPLSADIEECALCIPSDMYRPDLGVTNFPVRLSKRPQREETTVVIVLQAMRCNSPHFLLFQRPKKGLLGGLWEFPGQTVSVGSEPTDKSTEVQEQAQLSVMNRIKSAVKCIQFDANDLQFIGQVVHLFSHIRMTYAIYTLSCEFSEVPNFGRWVSVDEFTDSAVSTAARKVFAHFQSSQNSTCVTKPSAKTKKRKASSPLVDTKQLRLTAFFS